LGTVDPCYFGGFRHGGGQCRHSICAKHFFGERDEGLFEAPEKRAKKVTKISKESRKPLQEASSAGPLTDVLIGFCVRTENG
jgi:hypothetical protein